MPAQPYIAIEGAIGVGKTTLARILGESLPAQVLLEVFEENPFLSSFYSDRARYAFQTQVFFLLSRYRQQHKVIAETLKSTPLVSDYLFAKDWLFAHLNLSGDELSMYERVYAILGEQIPTPDLVVYLKASTDSLMQRIALRDRPYERQMSTDYINDLRLDYDQFFVDYSEAPLLVVDTNNLDIVRDPEARSLVIGQVKNALQQAIYQPLLPEMEDAASPSTLITRGRRLPELQRFYQTADHADGLAANLFLNYMQLSGSIGAIGRTLASVWTKKDELKQLVGNDAEAGDRALQAQNAELQEQLADVLASLLRIANDAGIDLEAAYLKNRQGAQ